MKKSKFFKIVFCLMLAFAFGATGIGLQTLGAARAENPTTSSRAGSVSPGIQDLGVVRPEDIDEGLSTKSLSDIRGRRVTVRQPIMEVLNYEVERHPENVEEVSDTYEFLDLKDGHKLHDLAQVTFKGELGVKTNPKYPMVGLENSSKEGDGRDQKYFSAFEKYALLRQAYYFNTHVKEILEKNELRKHPAADYIYGKIPDTAKAVKMRIVTDPIYRSPMTTGLYLVPGEVATITIKGLKAGEKLNLYTHHQDTMGYKGYDQDNKDRFGTMEDYFKFWDDKIVERATAAQAEHTEPKFEEDHYGLQGQWKWQNQKVPCMSTKFEFVGDGGDMTVKIGSMYGGPLYFQPTDSPVEMIIEGAVLTPHFVLGVTKVKDFEEHYRNAPGLIATLDCENGQLIGPAIDMTNCDDIEKIAYFWHSVFAIDISLNGRAYNYNMTMCYDIHVPAGEAVALNSNFCAQPTYWFDTCMNYEELTTRGNWGTFHELGHVQAQTYGVNWGFAEGDGEVWNNTLILIIYSMLCNMDNRLTPVEHGEFVHPYTAIERSMKVTKQYTDKEDKSIVHNITDYGQINNGDGAHFDQLSMYSTLLHSFGPDKFIDMFYTYKLNKAYSSNKRADFVYRIGLVDRVNITKWVNENYFANIKDEHFSSEQLAFLNSLPDFYPIAYRWANGIDGNETARKYEVDGKFKTIFDLSGNNIISPKEFEIVDVNNVKNGTIHYDENKKIVTYQPPEDITEYDSFDIIVKTLGGRQVTLNVNLKLLYRGSYAEVWNMGAPSNSNKPNLEAARKYSQEHEATSFEESSAAGKNDFNHPYVEYFKMKFKFIATEDGEHKFYLRADDASCVQFFNEGQMDGKAIATMSTTSDKQSFGEENGRMVTINLTKGQRLDVLAELVNWGGLGHLHIGVKMPSYDPEKTKNIPDIPTENIINFGVTKEELEIADNFKGWQPQFVDSIKDVAIDDVQEKTTWAVLEAPANENGCGKENLIDGNEGTIYHSHYSGNSKPNLPHVFVFDMKKAQDVNYFEFIRRNNNRVTDRIDEFALYAMGDCEYNADTMGGENNTLWTELFNSKIQNPESQQRLRVNFEIKAYRYFKLVIKANGGNTVIKEVNAGLSTQLNQTVKPSHYKTENGIQKFEENPANGKLSTKAQGAIFEFEFLGSSFEIFSDTGKDYGTAKVYIDDTQVKEEINLNEEQTTFNKCVFRSGALKTQKHKVKVETTSGKEFNISFVNVVYGTPVDEGEYPALEKQDGTPDFGDEKPLIFTREWRTYIKDYNTITSLKFLKDIPEGYEDTYIRLADYIRVYRKIGDETKVAIVYKGTIKAPSECGSLFAGCEKVTEIDLSNFDTSSTRGAVSMFNGCISMENISLSSMDTKDMQSIGTMFANCVKLTTIDLSNFKLMEDINAYRIFDNCFKLKTIKLPTTFTGDITFELPYVYKDINTNKYYTSYNLTSSTAGHTLEVHEEHTFKDANSHHDKIDPRCEIEGTIAYNVCDVCNFKFDCTDQSKLLSESDLVIPALEHYIDYGEGTRLPTCTESGGTVLKCKNCGKIIGAESNSEYDKPQGHLYGLDYTKATGKGYEIEFDENGTLLLKIYFKCMAFDFNPLLTNPEAEAVACNHELCLEIILAATTHEEVTCSTDETFTFQKAITRDFISSILNPEDKEIPDDLSFAEFYINLNYTGQKALKHEYVESWGEWTENGDSYSRQITFTCDREGCEHTYTATSVVTVEKQDATCEHDGHKTFTATFTPTEEGLYTQETFTETKTEVLNKLGHSYIPASTNPLEWKKQGHYNLATLHLVCTRCDAHEDNHALDIDLVAKQTTAGTYTCGDIAGTITYTVNAGLELDLIKEETEGSQIDENAIKGLKVLTQEVTGKQICHIWELDTNPYEWQITNNKLIVKLVCKNCHETLNVPFDAELTSHDATCTEAQQFIYTVLAKTIDEVEAAANACEHRGVTLYEDDTFTVVPTQQTSRTGKEALGHNFVDAIRDNGDGTHSTKCSRCETYSEGVEHVYDVIWNWSESYEGDEPTLTVTLRCDDCHHQINNSLLIVTITKDTDRSFDPSCTKEGIAIFNATVNYQGKTYSTQKEDGEKQYQLEKIGHNYQVVGVNWAKSYSKAEQDTTIEVECSHCKAQPAGEVTVSYEKNGDSYNVIVKYGNQILTFADGVKEFYDYGIVATDNNNTPVVWIIVGAIGGACVIAAIAVAATIISKKKRKKFEKN